MIVRPRLNDFHNLPFTQEGVDFAIPFLSEGTFVPSVLDGEVEGSRSSKACTGLADYDQIAYALHEMFHGAKSLRQALWAKRILGTFGTNVPYDC